MSGAIPLLFLYSFMVWTWKNKCDPEPILKFCLFRHVENVPSKEVVLCNQTDLNGGCEIDYRFPPPVPCCIRNLGC
jgi:hypothetical protein